MTNDFCPPPGGWVYRDTATTMYLWLDRTGRWHWRETSPRECGCATFYRAVDGLPDPLPR